MNCTRWKRAAEHAGGRLHGQRLREPGHALDQQVAAGEQADEHPLEHRVLAGDDAPDLEERALEALVDLGRVRALRARGRARPSGWAGRRRSAARSLLRLGRFGLASPADVGAAALRPRRRRPPARSDPHASQQQHTSLRVGQEADCANASGAALERGTRGARGEPRGQSPGHGRRAPASASRDSRRHVPPRAQARAGGERASDRRCPSSVARRRRVHAVRRNQAGCAARHGHPVDDHGDSGSNAPRRRARG